MKFALLLLLLLLLLLQTLRFVNVKNSSSFAMRAYTAVLGTTKITRKNTPSYKIVIQNLKTSHDDNVFHTYNMASWKRP